MKHKQTQQLERRKVLKTAALTGTGLAATPFVPNKWLRPVVASVVLPAHAATTDDTANLGTNEVQAGSKYYLDMVQDAQINPANSLPGFSRLTAPAHAGGLMPMLAQQLSSLFINDSQAESNLLSNFKLQFFLEKLGEDSYHFIYYVYFDGDIELQLPAKVYLSGYLDGLIKLGSNTLQAHICGADSVPVTFELNSVSPTEALITFTSEETPLTITLPFNASAVEPYIPPCSG